MKRIIVWMSLAATAWGDWQQPPSSPPADAPKLPPLMHKSVTWAKQREMIQKQWRDYLGEFPLESSGAYIFTVKITPPGHAQPYVVKFNQDYVVD